AVSTSPRVRGEANAPNPFMWMTCHPPSLARSWAHRQSRFGRGCFRSGRASAKARPGSPARTTLASYDFHAPRLFLDAPLAAGGRVALDRTQANYLLNVL